MKILIITVAGMSTRFSRSVGKEVIKCLYHEDNFSGSLLYRMLHLNAEFDKYIIVGGYRYDELEAAVKENFPELSDRIIMTENKAFEEYGSGYSLYCGIMEAVKYSPDEIVFAEGDLFVDEASFIKVVSSDKSVLTYNSDPITAAKAVAMYIDAEGAVRYIYDTGHSALEIKEPFLAVYNSGQIWKFSSLRILRETLSSMSAEDWTGTNLVMIENYFRRLSANEYEMIGFDRWINCNTVQDFRKI